MPRRRPESLDEVERKFLAAFGARVGRLRRHHGLTQTEVAAGTGCSLDMAGRYERGQNFPTGLMLARLGQTLQVSLDFLVLGKCPFGVIDRRLLDLLVAIERLPPERVEELVRFASAFLGLEGGQEPLPRKVVAP